MRRGFILVVLGLGALAVLAAMVVSSSRRNWTTAEAIPGPAAAVDRAPIPETPVPGEPSFGSQATASPARSAAVGEAKRVASPLTEPVDGPGEEQQEQREARVAARIAELADLSRKTDRASLEILLSEVRNPDAEIRQSALDAISQSGHRAAIPGLREAAALTQDAGAKEAIEEVIEFISLPTLTEVLRGQNATNKPGPAGE